MVEGLDGMMWFGMVNGLWSYDGIEWENYLVDEVVGCIVIFICWYGDGSLYVFGGWGISYLVDGCWIWVFFILLGCIFDFWIIFVNKFVSGCDGELWVVMVWGVLYCCFFMWIFYMDFGIVEWLW